MGQFRDTFQQFFHAVESGELDELHRVLHAICTEDLIVEMPMGQLNGIAEFWSVEKGFVDMADPKITVIRDIESDTGYAVEFVYEARQVNPFELPDGSVLAPSGRTVTWKLCETAEFRDGRISVWSSYWDNLTLCQQLGVNVALNRKG